MKMNFNNRSLGILTTHEESFPYYNGTELTPEEGKQIVVKYNAFNPFLLKTNYPNIKNNIYLDQKISEINTRKLNFGNIESWLLKYKSYIENSNFQNNINIKEKSVKWINILIKSIEFNTNENLDIKFIERIHRLIFENFPKTKILVGEFRKLQNWIDSNYAWNPDLADFVPPHQSNINILMQDWIYSYNKKVEYPYIHAAILYYQFMVIHPFEDGNEKTCRILITLYFLKNHIYNENFILLKSAIRREREKSNTILRCVSLYGSFDDWIKYFLTSLALVIENKSTNQVIDLY
ncbi:Fic family protein [Leptospira meyeri]|nr:Fic family protein [Leptospira meyeri]